MAFVITNPKKFYTILILLLAFGVFVAYRALWGSSHTQRSGEFTIEPGQGAASVWTTLKDSGFVSRTLPVRYYSARGNVTNSLQAGTYQIQSGEHVRDLVTRFSEGDTLPSEFSITYPEGFTLQQTAERTAEKGIGTAEEFMTQATVANYQDQFAFLQGLAPERSLEGYLFPDTYNVAPDDTPAVVIERMLANFNRKLTDDLKQEIAASDHTLDEIVNMASIIEREVQLDEDMAIVSGILWSRIEDGEGLYVDATTRYALEKPTAPLTVEDLAVDSPYNTRKYRGLPPTPISNPSLRAMLAALRPEETEYYYYLSAPDGKTIFATTNDEHNANKTQYLQ